MVGERGRPRRGLLLHGLPLLLSQVLLLRPRLFLHLLARLLLHLVGRGPLLPLSFVGRRPLLAPFTVGRGPVLPLFLAERGPLLLYLGDLSFQLGVLGACGLKVDLPRRSGGET